MSANEDALSKLAMEYASCAPADYQSGKFSITFDEGKRARLRTLMEALSNPYKTQEAIRRAEKALKLVDYHSDFLDPEGDPIYGQPF